MYKIMIIEDDMTIAKTLKEHLSKWNYDIIYATNFKNVMGEFNKFKPHIVLLDVILPFFNGFYHLPVTI